MAMALAPSSASCCSLPPPLLLLSKHPLRLPFSLLSHLRRPGRLVFRVALTRPPGLLRKSVFASSSHDHGDDAPLEVVDSSLDPHALPCKVNISLTVESWGTVYRGPGAAKYWNAVRHYPYTVGYTVLKSYKGRNFRQTIEEGPEGPLFVVEEMGKGVYSGESPTKVWNDVVQADGLRVNGPRHFGYASPEVIKFLQALGKQQNRSEEEISIENEMHSSDIETDILSDELVLETVASEEEQDFAEEDEVMTEEERDDEEAMSDDESEDEVMLKDEQDSLAFDDYSPEPHLTSEHAEDDSSEFSEAGSLLTDFRQSFGSPARREVNKIPTISDELDKYEVSASHQFMEEVSENDDIDFGASNNAVYHPPFLRSKASTLEKQIWKRGEGLTGHGIGSGKQQIVERPGFEQWSSSNDVAGLQPKANSNGFKSWEGSLPRKKDDSLKSSQLLLELLQKWNKIKKWNNDSGDRLRGRGESKHFRAFEEIDIGKEPKYEDDMGDDRSRSVANKSGSLSETYYSGFKGNSPQMRRIQSPEVSNGPLSENGKSVLEELRISNSVDESTNYAISRLFETVGKKNNAPAGKIPQSRPGKSVMEEPKMTIPEEKVSIRLVNGRLTEVVETNVSAQAADGNQGVRNLVEDKLKDFNSAEKKVNDRVFEAVKKKTDNELWSENLERDNIKSKDGSNNAGATVVEMGGKKSVMHGQTSGETKLIEDVQKLLINKRFEDALSTIRSMRRSGMKVDQNVYEAILGFQLDSWQKEVFKEMQQGKSVLVSAPSGAGKSATATCCLYGNMVDDQRALLVTPYEHLAKQELEKFRSTFGQGNVGGMWANMRAQKDLKVIVITLENLAKILQELNGPGGSEFCFFFEGINLVVLDKFHTVGDAKHGSLWEEVLMLMDPKIRVLALTLPANNEDQIASWIDVNRGPCKLVSTKSQPVPKRYLFCHNSGLLLLLDPNGSEMNRAFSQTIGGSFHSSMDKEERESFFCCGYDKPSLRYAFSILEDNVMLPVLIVFFDVKSCREALIDAFSVLGDGLLSLAETEKVEGHLSQLGEDHPELYKLIDDQDREALLQGFATYHEGKVPFWQRFVLKLFQENLVKLLIVTESILFQTEMVARTVILPTACKALKDGVSSIPPEEFLQLVGSAGRRGYDIEGNVIFLKSFYSGPKEAASLLLDSIFNISPCFKPSYSLVANLLAKHKLAGVKKILSRSFSEFVFYHTHAKARVLKELDQKVLDSLESKADLEVKLFQGLTEVNKQKLLDAPMFARVDIRMTIHSASQGGNVLPGILLAVVPSPVQSSSGPAESFYMVFGVDNKFRLLPAGALDHVYGKEVPPLDVVYKRVTGQTIQPPPIPPKDRWTLEDEGTCGYVASGNLQNKEFVKLLMEHPVHVHVAKEGLHLRKEIQVLESQISKLIGKKRTLSTEKHGENLKEQVEQIEASTFNEDQSDIWQETLRRLKILERVDALSISESQGAHVKLKPLGMLISRLHNVENELWVAMVVTSRYVKPLLPAEFAGVAASMVPQKPEVESFFIDHRELLYRVGKPVKDAFAEFKVLRKHVAALQGSYSPPLHFDLALAGMVYAWARGKPGTGNFYISSVNDGDVSWNLRKVAKFADCVYEACSHVSMDIPDSDDSSSLAAVAKRAEQLLSRYLTAVDGSA